MDERYMPAWPDEELHPAAKDFISKFYQLSDKFDQNEAWVDLFDEGATLIMGLNRAEGKEEIAKLRLGMWDKIACRQHTLDKVFGASFNGSKGSDVLELVILGSVDLLLETGELKTVDWAGHACLKGDAQTGLRFSYYRVYLQT